MIKKILMTLGFILAGFVVYAALKPADYMIKRTVVINAKPEAIFPYMVNMKKADQWMPWKESDPQVKISYSNPEEGIGAISSWESSGNMGTGKAEVVGVVANQSVQTKISYTRPMEMTQISEFSLAHEGENTKMSWSVSGQSPFFARLMCTLTFMNMDKYVGGMFENGLNKLKAIVEKK